MNKKTLIAPIITFSLSLLLLGSGFVLFFAYPTDYQIENAKEKQQQIEINIADMTNDLIIQKEDLNKLNLDKESHEYQNRMIQIQEYENHLKMIEDEKIFIQKEIEIAEQAGVQKYKTALLVGILVILLISFLAGLIVFLLIRFKIFKNDKFKKKLYLIGFWASFLIMLFLMGEKDKTPALCFALIAVGFLIAHNLTKLAFSKEESFKKKINPED